MNPQKSLDKSLRLIIKTSLVVFLGLFISKLLTYVYRILVARYFGPETYGLFSLALMVFSFSLALASLGLMDGLSRYIPLYRGKKEFNKISYILRFSFVAMLLSSFVIAIIIFFSSKFISLNLFHSNALIIYIQYFSLILPLAVLLGFFLSIIRSFEEVKMYSFIQNILQNVAKVSFLIVIILLASIGLNINPIITSFFLSYVLALLVAYLFIKHRLPSILTKKKFDSRQNKTAISALFSYSWPLIFYSIIFSILYWVDSFSIGFLKSVVDVGIYSAAVPIAAFFAITSDVFMQLFFPMITREFSKGKSKVIKELSKQVSKWIFIINLPLFMILFLFPGVFINFFFGPTYIAAETALRILSIGMLLYSLSAVSMNLLSMLGKSKIIMITILVSALANLILNFTLIPFYGINGAAISTAICYSALAITFILLARKYLSILPLKKEMLRIFFISLIPLILLIILKETITINIISLMLSGIFFIILYILLIYFTGCLDENDLMIIRSIKYKITHFSSDRSKISKINTPPPSYE